MFESIVVALDGSRSSDRALEYAAALAREHGSAVTAVHVTEMVVGRGGGTVRLNESAIQAGIDEQVKGLVESGIKAELKRVSRAAGEAADAIADVAERTGAQLIVTGTRGHSALAGLVVGSVAQRLHHVATCPVLTVPLAAKLHIDPVAAASPSADERGTPRG